MPARRVHSSETPRNKELGLARRPFHNALFVDVTNTYRGHEIAASVRNRRSLLRMAEPGTLAKNLDADQGDNNVEAGESSSDKRTQFGPPKGKKTAGDEEGDDVNMGLGISMTEGGEALQSIADKPMKFGPPRGKKKEVASGKTKEVAVGKAKRKRSDVVKGKGKSKESLKGKAKGKVKGKGQAKGGKGAKKRKSRRQNVEQSDDSDSESESESDEDSQSESEEDSEEESDIPEPPRRRVTFTKWKPKVVPSQTLHSADPAYRQSGHDDNIG